MFKLSDINTFTWPAKAKVPEAGKHKTVQFEATFKVLSQPEITALIGEDDVGGSMRVLDASLVSFSGIDVSDEDGHNVTDDDERKEILFRYPFFVEAISSAFAAGMSGYRTKN